MMRGTARALLRLMLAPWLVVGLLALLTLGAAVAAVASQLLLHIMR